MKSKIEQGAEAWPARRSPLDGEWVARLTRLHRALEICQSDIPTRCELATLLEELDQPEDALLNWQAILARDPNSLAAREGIARCRGKIGRPLQRHM